MKWNDNIIGTDNWYKAVGGEYWEWSCFGSKYLSKGKGTLRLESQSWRYMETDNIVITASPYFTPSGKGVEGSDSHSIGTNTPPYEPSNPNPSNGASGVSVYTSLSWSGGDPDGETVYYDVYLEANDPTPDVMVSYHQTSTTYTPPDRLNCDTHYYWKIVATDEGGETTEGDTWSFYTEEAGIPDVETQSFASISTYSATLYGKLLDDGGEDCSCYITFLRTLFLFVTLIFISFIFLLARA